MITIRKTGSEHASWVVLALVIALTGCHHTASSAKHSAQGQVLAGSVSDAMLPYDTVTSEPPLAPMEERRNGTVADQTAVADSVTSADVVTSADGATSAGGAPDASGDMGSPGREASPAGGKTPAGRAR